MLIANLTLPKELFEQLATMQPYEAFKMAIEMSSLKPMEARRALGWSESFWYRVMNDEKFYPSVMDIPHFCNVVGNPIVIFWQAAQLQEATPQPTDDACRFLTKELMDITHRLGELAASVSATVEDNKVELHEYKDVSKKLGTLMGECFSLSQAVTVKIQELSHAD
ncbi:phage regulatory CII family protein [Desulfovibrio cuneatus]|uniref:phage regulatory CII family protein n=1 Tax=Desulfovibrio cuneatus TaxID=159728 RepID=UPI000405F5CF|nr:phage regulatory CII family protein [Desulfovibrio cuneatus]